MTVRLSAAFRAEWSRILLAGDYHEEQRAKLAADAESADRACAKRLRYILTMRICDRWAAAGYTSASLVAGLPRPERPHPAAWHREGRLAHCLTCARPFYKDPLPDLCGGPHPFDLVHEAVAAGVPFGLRDGLPTAGVEVGRLDPVKFARATCRPRF